ncbi:trypsin-like peptidase domain-containing protein [Streptomyces sp. NRRL S-31]|uniref:trypsin-like peptidase domain-containing protein n=1 Tax=Streptomyces sp. NRRL S-31 TaxID=1463898 RepID=UPI0020A66052|nr:trypsin-like peptidase domain-containing protein [Streptomyces sp. NRRL S-31]
MTPGENVVAGSGVAQGAGEAAAGVPGAARPSGESVVEGREVAQGAGEVVAGVRDAVVTSGASADGGRDVAPAAGAAVVVARDPVAVDGVAHTASGTAGAERGERPRPLHDPDPYSTPPYGRPGPWAPAPPVQHPAVASAAAPAHGTAVPAPVTLPPPSAVPPAVAPPVPLSAPQTPADTSASHAQAPAPVAAGPLPPGAVSAPVVPGPAPHAPAPVAAGSAAVPPGGSGAQGGDPWGRYDPWAAGTAEEQASARGPLQQTGAKVPTRAQRRRRAWRHLAGWTLAVAVVSAGVGGIAGAYVARDGLGDGVRLPRAAGVPAGRAPDSVAGIAARALPSVVTLHVRGADQAGTGTGFVLDDRGHILTNNHVVQPAGPDGEISVTFSSGDTVKAEVVGRDSGYDLAVVRVRGVHGLTPLPLGDSDTVQVGDPVVAIGAPFDLANTVTAGIISAKERPITAGGEKSDGSDVAYVDALQTDAPINPGNSGGPLLDSRAQVIGINSAIRSAGSGSDAGGGEAGSIGLGFAIPVNQAWRVARELISDGRATHPVIGVTLDMGYGGDGARIDDESARGGPAVAVGGAGERAGLKAGDVVTDVDGERVHTGEELIVKIRAHRPGDRLRLTVARGGTEREVSLVLGESEQN